MANKDEKKSGNTLVHDTIALTVITLIAGILLGGVYTITKKPIEQQNEKIRQRHMPLFMRMQNLSMTRRLMTHLSSTMRSLLPVRSRQMPWVRPSAM